MMENLKRPMVVAFPLGLFLFPEEGRLLYGSCLRLIRRLGSRIGAVHIRVVKTNLFET